MIHLAQASYIELLLLLLSIGLCNITNWSERLRIQQINRFFGIINPFIVV